MLFQNRLKQIITISEMFLIYPHRKLKSGLKLEMDAMLDILTGFFYWLSFQMSNMFSMDSLDLYNFYCVCPDVSKYLNG